MSNAVSAVEAEGPLSREQAEANWDRMRDSFVNAGTEVVFAIRHRTWESLGYPSFAEAWVARMRGVPLGTSVMAAHVIYELYREGATRQQIVETVKGSGVGPEKVDVLIEQAEIGVPPEVATTRVRRHVRALPGTPHILHIPMDAAELARFHRLCVRHKLDLQSEALTALRERMSGLDDVDDD